MQINLITHKTDKIFNSHQEIYDFLKEKTLFEVFSEKDIKKAISSKTTILGKVQKDNDIYSKVSDQELSDFTEGYMRNYSLIFCFTK